MLLALISGSFGKGGSKGKNVYHLELKKRRVHHSCIGLGCFIACLFIWFTALISFGLGLIISHSIREKSVLFVEIRKEGDKWKKYF